MTIDEAIEFFGRCKDKTCVRIAAKLRPLADVGSDTFGWDSHHQPSPAVRASG
jgi:hypothetical protein